MEYVIVFIIGAVIGAIIFSLIMFSNCMGYLRIDMSDPSDKPYLFLELETDVQRLSRKKQIVLQVKKENYISHN